MIAPEYQKILNEAKSKKKENKKFLYQLKRKNPSQVDKDFHSLHEEVFEEIDCLKCANCCSTTSPIFRDADINRLAKYLRLKPSELIDRYLHLDDENDYVLNSSPCPFLGEDKYCSVYEHRPLACREYPHTDRKKMNQILDLTYKNTLICPAAARIVERMKS